VTTRVVLAMCSIRWNGILAGALEQHSHTQRINTIKYFILEQLLSLLKSVPGVSVHTRASALDG
jgi:hypothetical protein